jgi:hypothetical protein
MKFRCTLILLIAAIVLTAQAAPTYRSFLEWNGPYYHVRHAVNADTSSFLNYTVNDPLPLYSAPFSIPTAIALTGTAAAPTAFVTDRNHRRVQAFNINAAWQVETLGYSNTPIEGSFGHSLLKFLHGGVLPGSEKITINGRFFRRVSSLSGYAAADSVYSMIYDGPPGTGGVVTLPAGWNLDATDSVRAEYAYASPAPQIYGTGDVDYVLQQVSPPNPTDLPLQLNEATSAVDPAMSELTSIAVNSGVNHALDLYLVNSLPGDSGTLASYTLDVLGAGGVFRYVDRYPGKMGRPYDVEIVDRGPNSDGTLSVGTTGGVSSSQITETISNQNTFLGHTYRIAYTFDTTTALNGAANPTEADLAFDAARGRLHVVMARAGVGGIFYGYSNDDGMTWSAPRLISPDSLNVINALKAGPRLALRSTGEIWVIYEAVNSAGERQLYTTHSADGSTWESTACLTAELTPATVTQNSFANLLINPVNDDVHLIWAGDDDVYHRIYTTSWSAAAQIAAGADTGSSAPHSVMNGVGDIFLTYVSDATPGASVISYLVYNGAAWGSYNGGSWNSTPDSVTNACGFSGIGASIRGAANPFPQIALSGGNVWIFWVGDGTNVYGSDHAQLYFKKIGALNAEFPPAGAGTPLTSGDDCAPLPFNVKADAQRNLHIVYAFASTENQEGLRYKRWELGADEPSPNASAPGRTIFAEGTNAVTWAFAPRMITTTVAGQDVPLLVCGKSYASWNSTRTVFKIVDGVLRITDETDHSIVNARRLFTHGTADETAIPGVAFTITNSNNAISNTDNVNETEFNFGDSFVLQGTPPIKNDLLFLSDIDSNRVRVVRAYENVPHCFAGGTRWDVPGQSDGSPGQTYKLATVGSQNTYRVWASADTTTWAVVNDLLIAGAHDQVCEINRYTREIRFGDNVHGAIPMAGTFIRVRYVESVDEAVFGQPGNAAGQMTGPKGLAVRYNTNLGQYDIYVCDAGNNRLQKWAFRRNSAVDPAGWTSFVTSWNMVSSATDALLNPEDVDVVAYNNKVYLVAADNGHSRLVIYRDDEASGSGGNAAPVYVATVGSHGCTLNQFLNPLGVAAMAEDSGLVIFAADGGRNEVMKIAARDWLTTSEMDTGHSGGEQVPTLTLNFADPADGDGYLLVQPGAVRTLELRVAHTDSLIAMRVAATFPVNLLHVLSINEGNLWSGERYTNRVFLTSVDNTAGKIEINASMVGDNDGMTQAGPRVVASLVIRADSAMQVPATGALSLTDSSDLRQVNNVRVTLYNHPSFNLRGSYLGDIAAVGGAPGVPPDMIPQPDGRIDFSDVNVFTQGWNGNGVIFDPLADIGPYLGTSVPALVANRDGRLDAYDLLALTTMYNWYSSSHAITMPPAKSGSRALDNSGPIVIAVRPTGAGWAFEVQVHDVSALTTAHLYLQFAAAGAQVASVQCGDFLGDGALFLPTVQEATAEISMGRLNPSQPCASGDGTLAIINVFAPTDQVPELRLVYELRDNHNDVVASAEISHAEVEAIPVKFSLEAPYPNPFNSITTFTLNLAEASHASLIVYNILGQKTAEIVNRNLSAGVHRFAWEARDGHGLELPSGIYLVRFAAAGRTDVRKLVLLR